MNGNFTYLRSSGVETNRILYLRCTSINRSIQKNLDTNAFPGNNDSPNVELNLLGTTNRVYDIEGVIPVVSGLAYPAGLGTLSDASGREMSLSGLGMFEITGSKIYFYDEVMTSTSKKDTSTYFSTSGVFVRVDRVQLNRNTDFVESEYEVGTLIPYRISLVEDK